MKRYITFLLIFLLTVGFAHAALPDFSSDRNITFPMPNEGIKNATMVCFKDGTCFNTTSGVGGGSVDIQRITSDGSLNISGNSTDKIVVVNRTWINGVTLDSDDTLNASKLGWGTVDDARLSTNVVFESELTAGLQTQDNCDEIVGCSNASEVAAIAPNVTLAGQSFLSISGQQITALLIQAAHLNFTGIIAAIGNASLVDLRLTTVNDTLTTNASGQQTQIGNLQTNVSDLRTNDSAQQTQIDSKINASQDQNNYTVDCSVTGTTSKTVTCSRNGATNVSFSFTDIDTDTNNGGISNVTTIITGSQYLIVTGNATHFNVTLNATAVNDSWNDSALMAAINLSIDTAWKANASTQAAQIGALFGANTTTNGRIDSLDISKADKGTVLNTTTQLGNTTGGNVNVTGTFSSLVLYANCVAITGSSELCDGSDAGTGGGMTSFILSNGSTTEVITDGEQVNITAGRNVSITQVGSQLVINAVDTDTSNTSAQMRAATNNTLDALRVACGNITGASSNLCTLTDTDTNSGGTLLRIASPNGSIQVVTNSTDANVTVNGTWLDTQVVTQNEYPNLDTDSTNDLTTSSIIKNTTGSRINITGTYQGLVATIPADNLTGADIQESSLGTVPTATSASTATALAADPANCAAGSSAAGVTAGGVAEGCQDTLNTSDTAAGEVSGTFGALVVGNDVLDDQYIELGDAFNNASGDVNVTGTYGALVLKANCVAITGSAALCDGSDDGAGGGGFSADQEVNRTSNVTFNSLNISSPGDPIIRLNGSGYCWLIKMESTEMKIIDCDGSVIATFNKDSDTATFKNLIGTSSYSGATSITGTSSSGQTADILQIKNSSGSVLLRVEANGTLNASKGIRTNLSGCDSVDTLADGTLVCGTDAGAGSGDGTGGWTNTTTVTSATVNVSISQGNEYQINGNGIVTRTGTNAVVLGNTSGDARGSNAIDVQQRTQTTEVCSGSNSICFGYRNTNSGAQGVAIGSRNTVTNSAFAFGLLNVVTGNSAVAIGSGTSAGNDSSFAFGANIINNVQNSLMFGVNDSGKLTILGNGYVGINTINPTYTLEVNGTLAANGYPIKSRWTNKTTSVTAVTGTTLGNISGLEWTALANTNYSADCTFWYDSNLTTNGISFAFEDWGGAVSSVRYGPSTFSISATTVNSGTVSGMGTKVTSTGVTAANTVYLAKVYATIINGATNVQITPQMSAEIASSKSQVNIMSTCEVKEI